MDWDSPQGVKANLGLGPNASLKEAQRSPHYFYSYAFDFSALAAGSNTTVRNKITAAGAFVVDMITGNPHDGTGGAADDDLLFVELSGNDGGFQKSELPWKCIIGTAQNPFYPLFKLVFGPGTEAGVKIRNGSAAAVTGSVVFLGHVLRGK